MFQKTFIRFTLMIAFTFMVGILLMAFHRSNMVECENNLKHEVKQPAQYGEYIILESLSTTVLSVN